MQNSLPKRPEKYSRKTIETQTEIRKFCVSGYTIYNVHPDSTSSSSYFHISYQGLMKL